MVNKQYIESIFLYLQKKKIARPFILMSVADWYAKASLQSSLLFSSEVEMTTPVLM